MNVLALSLVLVAITHQAASIIAQQYLLDNKILTKRGALVLQHSIGCLTLLLYLFFWPLAESITGLKTPIYKDFTIFWIAIAWLTLCNLFIQSANVHARSLAPPSLTVPFQGMTPLLVTFTALVFYEYPTLIGWVAISTIAVFTYLHGREGAVTPLDWWRGKTTGGTLLKDWLMPMRIAFRLQLPYNFATLNYEERETEMEKAKRIKKGVRWAIASTFGGTFGLMGDGTASRHGNIIWGLTVVFAIISLWYLTLPWLWYLLKKHLGYSVSLPEPILPSRENLRLHHWRIFLSGFGHATQWMLINIAFRLAPIAYIGSMKRLHIALVLVFAAVFLKDRKTRRFVTGLGITLGAAMLALDQSAQAFVIDSAEGYAFRLKEILAKLLSF